MNSLILAKFKTILTELRLEMLLSEKFKMRTFRIKHKVPSNFQKALYDTELVSKTEGKSEYKWLVGEVTTNLTKKYLLKYREINNDYALKQKVKSTHLKKKSIKPVTFYKHHSLEKKCKDFLTEIYNELVVFNNRKLAIRQLLIKHNMSDSSRKALFDLGLISNYGDRNGREYKWLYGELNQKLIDKYLAKIREINKTQKAKQDLAYSKKVIEKKPDGKSNPLVFIGFLLVTSTIVFRTLKRFR